MYKLYDNENGHCLECGEPIYGRTDKRFCNRACKNRWHNGIRHRHERQYNLVLKALETNYTVLEHLYKFKNFSCPVQELLKMGFSTDISTHLVQKKGKHLEYRCFDFIYNLSCNKLFNLRRL
ncbi:MAG: hypothetical protein IJU68_07085 [Bacteroidales bacterium]|nr:hypothetical protein [Bacteroidales bacterium]